MAHKIERTLDGFEEGGPLAMSRPLVTAGVDIGDRNSHLLCLIDTERAAK
jgi:hypothetical protein